MSDPVPDPAPPGSAASDVPQRERLARLLIVEDNLTQLETLTAIMEAEGFEVTGCPTSVEALQHIATKRFGVAILDLRLPDLEGSRLLEEVRSRDSYVRVIIHTGYGSFGSAVQAVNSGAFAYLEKLGDPAELVRHVRRAVADYVRQYTTTLEAAVAERTARLAESESRLRAVVAAAGDAILVLDEGGVLDTFNRAAERLFGYAAADVLGRPEPGLIAGPDAGGDAWRVGDSREVVGRRRDGRLFPLDLSVSELLLGPRRLVVAIGRDVSERHRAEQERQRLESQVRQSQKLEALGTLAGGIAHDFNNILAGIQGFTELTLHVLPGGGVEAANLREVLKAVGRASGLVRQILAFSRRSELDRQPVALGRAVTEAVGLLRPTLPAGTDIVERVAADAGQVLADATQLHQVVLNLCSNAVHAMRATGGAVRVTVEPVADPRAVTAVVLPPRAARWLRLTVADTGHGMTAEVRERIFDPFFTTKEVGEGTGLGLAVVHRIVEGLGGKIAVHSEPGRGATFDVYLPAHAAPEAGPPAPPALPGRGHGRVLAVDDEPTVLSWLGQFLAHLGFEAEILDNGPDALARFRQDPDHFDLVITDFMMPRMTGEELARELLRLRPDLPILLTTGYTDQASAATARALGVREFLMKPIGMTQLAEAIRRHLPPRP